MHTQKRKEVNYIINFSSMFSINLVLINRNTKLSDLQKEQHKQTYNILKKHNAINLLNISRLAIGLLLTYINIH